MKQICILVVLEVRKVTWLIEVIWVRLDKLELERAKQVDKKVEDDVRKELEIAR
jgi:hypothetical protein